MSTRTRPPKRGEVDVTSLSKAEKLLVAQAVFELGTDAWADVAKLLAKHSLVNRPKNSFTAQSCNGIYVHLMEEAGFDITPETGEPKSQTNKQLAEQLWQARYDELKSLICAEEENFMTKSREIDEIRAGKWDEQIQKGRQTRKGTSVLQAPVATSADATATGVSMEIEPVAETPLPMPQHTETASLVPVIPDYHSSEESNESPPPDAGADTLELGDDQLVTDAPDVTLAPDIQESIPESAPAEIADIRETSPSEPDTNPEVLAEDQTEVKMESPERDGPHSDVEEGSSRENTPLAQLVRRDGKRKDSPAADSPRDAKRPREDSEPMDEDDDDDGSRRRGPREAVNKQFVNLITGLHNSIRDHRSGAIFHQPVKKSEAPDYTDIVRRPIDLKTIKARLREGQITNSLEYHRDISMMFANAMMYNRPSSDVYQMAEAMNNDVEKMIEDFRQTEGIIQRSR